MILVQPPVSVVARVNSDCADWGMSNADEFTHGTHDRNLNPATPAAQGQVRNESLLRLSRIPTRLAPATPV
jgi:hypothetical protein